MDKDIQDNLWRSIKFVLICLSVFWVFEIVDTYFLGQALNNLGILPLYWSGLFGVVTWPFLHSNFAHLISNSIVFVILGTVVAARNGTTVFMQISVVITVISGLLVWLLAGFLGGGEVIHIGASGLIFGYLGFLLARGIATRHSVDVVIAVAILVFYGSTIFEALPFFVPTYVSWQGHLFGLLSGIGVAFLLKEQ